MKQGILFCLSICLLLLSCGQGKQQDTTGETKGVVVNKGKQLFVDNCQQCHSLKQDKNGPRLEGVIDRWEGDTAHVISFIRNSQQMINSGQNAYSIRLFSTWSNTMMPPFSNLSDGDIKEILDYINKDVE